MSFEQTVAAAFAEEGVGLMSGLPCRATVHPAPERSGIRFYQGGVCIPARLRYVVDHRLATILGRGPARVGLVEHLCAALWAAGVDNAAIHVDGPEVPILDGSGARWTRALEAVGLRVQEVPRRILRVRRPVRVEAGDAWAELVPAQGFELELSVDFAHPAIGPQRWEGAVSPANFRRELAWARTFGFYRDAEALRAAGRAWGADLQNTVVYDEVGVMNPDGLRAPDEAVRHKALDAIGDAVLVGARLSGRLRASRAGHAMHHSLFRTFRQTHEPRTLRLTDMGPTGDMVSAPWRSR